MLNNKKENFVCANRLSSDLSKITGLSKSCVRNFTRILSLAFVHSVLEQKLSENFNGITEINLPFIGKLYLRYNDDEEIEVIDIVLLDSFKDDLIGALVCGNSPLITESEEKLVHLIEKKYESLL